MFQKMKEIEANLGCFVTTCVTDNAANMAGTRREIVAMQMAQIQEAETKVHSAPEGEREKKNAELADLRTSLMVDTYGCSAHLLNLWCAFCWFFLRCIHPSPLLVAKT